MSDSADVPPSVVKYVLEPPPYDPDVALVVPATAYDTIATDDELALRAAPRPEARAEESKAIDAIRTLESTLLARLDALNAMFEREVRAEATREKTVDRLHAELQEYKQDLLLSTLRPIFIDLIQFHDDIGKMVEGQGEAEGEAARLLGWMRGFQQGIEDILYRQGVEPFALSGPGFDPRRQRAVATVPTDDPDLVKLVALRHRKGFQAGERVIRPEIVSVYAPASPPPEPPRDRPLG